MLNKYVGNVIASGNENRVLFAWLLLTQKVKKQHNRFINIYFRLAEDKYYNGYIADYMFIN